MLQRNETKAKYASDAFETATKECVGLIDKALKGRYELVAPSVIILIDA